MKDGKKVVRKMRSGDFQKMFSNHDWVNYEQRCAWRLREPECSCEGCYSSWLYDGVKIYLDDIKVYGELREQALLRKRNKQEIHRLKREERGGKFYVPSTLV